MPCGRNRYEVVTLDKYEYKVRADEIKSLIAEGEYGEAVKIADTIDWRRVKSVMMLCTISDLYKINRRYEDSRDILLLAYERHAGGRLIVYSLCELSIKLGEYVQALEYYKEFVQLAPKDNGRFILQYKLYEAQEVSLEERIEVLEELKKREYREKWAYELAYLYHRVGLTSKCIEECDEMFLWFGEGRYVLKGLELKMLHVPLSQEQEIKYEQMKQNGGNLESEYEADQQAIQEEVGAETEEEDDEEFSLQENLLKSNTQEVPGKDLDIQVKTVDVSQYNTLNLQKELAESMKEFLETNKTQEMPVEETQEILKTQVFEPVAALDESPADIAEDTDADADDHIDAGTDTEADEDDTENSFLRQDTDEIQLISDVELHENEQQVSAAGSVREGSEEVFFGNTSEVNIKDVVSELAEKNAAKTPFVPIKAKPQEEQVKADAMQPQKTDDTGSTAPASQPVKAFHKPSGYDKFLSQEYDGQISLVVPEQEKIEKQITGQLSIEDIMAEWERVKKESEQKRMEEIRKRVHQQTDTLFADFDESTKSGLLEELEKAMVTAAMQEEKLKSSLDRPRVVKVADIEKEESDTRESEEEKIRQEIDALAEEALQDDIQLESEESEIAETEVKEEETAEETVAAKEEDIEIIAEEAEEEASHSEEGSEQGSQPEQTADEGENAKEQDEEQNSDVSVQENSVREMTNPEREQFAPFIHHKRTRRQIVEAIDNVSMAAYTGNVVITGEEGTGTIALAKLLVKEVQLSDGNFSGKVAKISAAVMNKKDVASTLSKLFGGALIIEGASALKKTVVEQLLKELNQEEKGLVVLIEDTKASMDTFLEQYPDMKSVFNLRVDVEALDDQTLVKYAKRYALEQEYSIDEMGILALHTRIADMQTSDHEVTLKEIEELVDEAIDRAGRISPAHFFDVLLGKRYDEEDMIVLREKDFMKR